jgi:hypothetical protein
MIFTWPARAIPPHVSSQFLCCDEFSGPRFLPATSRDLFRDCDVTVYNLLQHQLWFSGDAREKRESVVHCIKRRFAFRRLNFCCS